MSMFDKIKGLFAKRTLPEETKALFAKASSASELLTGLDDLLTRNEMEVREIDRELDKLERLEKDELSAVRGGDIGERQKRNTLLRIQRLRKQMDVYERRQRIYHNNINLHMQLMGRIQEMEAMELRGVDENEIDTVAERFDDSLERFTEAVHAGKALEDSPAVLSSQEGRELAALEAEIMGVDESKAPTKVKAEPLTVPEPSGTDLESETVERDVEAELAELEKELGPQTLPPPTKRRLELE